MPRSDPEGIELGDVAKDTISGFEGVVVAITDWLNGCRRLTLSPKTIHDGKPVDSYTFDVEQIELVKKAKPNVRAAHGGPHPDPSSHPAPRR